eukprot:GSA120T00005216001.1
MPYSSVYPPVTSSSSSPRRRRRPLDYRGPRLATLLAYSVEQRGLGIADDETENRTSEDQDRKRPGKNGVKDEDGFTAATEQEHDSASFTISDPNKFMTKNLLLGSASKPSLRAKI